MSKDAIAHNTAVLKDVVGDTAIAADFLRVNQEDANKNVLTYFGLPALHAVQKIAAVHRSAKAKSLFAQGVPDYVSLAIAQVPKGIKPDSKTTDQLTSRRSATQSSAAAKLQKVATVDAAVAMETFRTVLLGRRLEPDMRRTLEDPDANPADTLAAFRDPEISDPELLVFRDKADMEVTHTAAVLRATTPYVDAAPTQSRGMSPAD